MTQKRTIPLVILIAAHALLGEDELKVSELKDDLISSSDGDDYEVGHDEGVPREESYFKFPPAFDMNLTVSDSDDGSTEVLFVFEHEGEFAVAKVAYPDYCDDETDGRLGSLKYCGTNPNPAIKAALKGLVDYAEGRIKRAQKDAADIISGVSKLKKKANAKPAKRKRG